jgi:dipicolinate synthase subunit B
MNKERLTGVKIGVVLTASHCSMGDILPQIQRLKTEGAEIYAILSENTRYTDNRFYRAEDLAAKLEPLIDHPIISSIVAAEPIGPQKLLDLVLVMPATGNTVAKLANGITDTAALMAVKAHLRNQRPVVIALASNDALGMNAKNIGVLLNAKHIYFVPFRQDDPAGKVNSIVADMSLAADTVMNALQGRQMQPLLLGPV